ncbi:hypothetical protein [Limnohabitans radicicola]|uniref:Uncharacterized protein n=1 Tax=Limnohabitans radicicola TaxID=2771427 RepID=A0A927FHZ7_9BURK|nr:hypothetical protein [Limnohabitans radicicola]MBD8051331.1 hypothetical protein [Limnohabitans radicicola]
MKAVQFLVDFFAVDGSGNRFIKYAQGQTYPYDDETASQVQAGFAQLVQVETLKQAKAAAQVKSAAKAESPVPPAEEAATTTTEA